MMVHCTVVQPFIGIVGSIELQSSERAEAQGGRSWVELGSWPRRVLLLPTIAAAGLCKGGSTTIAEVCFFDLTGANDRTASATS